MDETSNFSKEGNQIEECDTNPCVLNNDTPTTLYAL